MRYAFYSPYLDSFGGGERYLAQAAEILAKKGEAVVFWDKPEIKTQLETRFNLNLKKVKIKKNIFTSNFFKKWQILKNFDLVFVLSDGSVPAPFAKKNILHFQQPFILRGRTLRNRLKLKKYIVVCNSNFTKKYIDQSFGINSVVIYPPVDVDFFKPEKKEKIILSVGRFLAGSSGKKQEILMGAFKQLIDDRRLAISDWRLYLAGGVNDQQYFNKLKRMAKGLPVKFFPDITAYKLKELYSVAAIYWHAKGFGENLKVHPEFVEHFGISVVEAQSAGCVPVVFKAGGVTEIINDGVDGFFWVQQQELIEKTKNLIQNPNLLKKLQKNSIENAKKFSKDFFLKKFEELME